MSTGFSDENWNRTKQCPACFYGPHCQFTTANYSISLEALLLTPILTKFSFIMMMIVMFLGTLGNLLSIATFSRPSAREMGNGIYRLWVAIVGQFGTMILGARLVILFNARRIDCFILEYLLSVSSSLYHFLTVCVVIEQFFVAYLNLSFSKERSRKVAKIVIPILIVYHLTMALSKPLQHQLPIDSHFERITNILHLTIPVACNFFMPIVMLILLIKHRISLKPNVTFCSNTINVLFTYRNNLTSPFILVLFTFPHLIVAFSFTCVTKSWQNTIYLVVYLISLFPLLLSFVTFICLSRRYTEELQKMFDRCFRYISLR